MNENMTALQVSHQPMAVTTQQAMTTQAVVARVNLVHEILNKVMVKGTHYGTVPGCGEKQVLLKPGADLLASTFRLVPQFRVDRTELENGHREYDVTCSMYAIDGTLVGQGVGSASTLEKKYRWRKDKSGQRIENEDIADVYNTVLKIAKKRAHIDATLTCTACADLFTQDLIDEEDVQAERPPITQPTVAAKSATLADNELKGMLSDVDEKTYEKKDGTSGIRYALVVNGEKYGTFSDTLATEAIPLIGSEVIIAWSQNGKYKNAESVRKA